MLKLALPREWLRVSRNQVMMLMLLAAGCAYLYISASLPIAWDLITNSAAEDAAISSVPDNRPAPLRPALELAPPLEVVQSNALLSLKVVQLTQPIGVLSKAADAV